ncbi:amidase [Kocuria coralli]|uniref:Amidase n=1 Tax=Kocuria coralli TaxID=1461025 RepID=A0A5J5KZU2_9MICC|nr:amidase [Kocuria coralli]KAA9394231.1 amidase [Kocuria coralli]
MSSPMPSPRTTDELPLTDAVALRDALRHGRVSSGEVATAVRERAVAVENPDSGPALGAFVHIAPAAEVTAAASALDDRPSWDRGRWHGLPMALKDLQEVEGQPTTQGSLVLAPGGPSSAPVAVADDETAALHRAHGALLFAKTQVPEFGLNCYSENLVAAPSRNPYDLECGSGGSSGGQAAAVAAGALPVAVGSDAGGSIRIPAAACGLIGLKPSRGMVPVGDGLADHTQLAVQGPLARTPADAALVFDGLTAHLRTVPGGNRLFRPVSAPGARQAASPWRDTAADAIAEPTAGRFRTAVEDSSPALEAVLGAARGRMPWGQRPLRIGVSTASPFNSAHPTPVSPEASSALQAGVDALRAAGHEVAEADFGYDPRYPEAFFALWTTSLGVAPLDAEQEDRLTGLARHYRRAALERSATDLAIAVRVLRDLEKATLRAWDAYDVVLTPALAQTPRPLGWWWEGFDPADPASAAQDYERQCRYTPFTSIVNVVGLPAVVVPTTWERSEFGGSRVPMGIQLIGRPGADIGLLALAEQVRGRLG